MQLVVPLEFVDKLLHQHHSTPTGAHIGCHKLLSIIKARYYWDTLNKDVISFVLSCERCLAAKSKQTPLKLPMKLHDASPSPFSRVVLDAVGPLTPSVNGYQYVQVLVDLYSRCVVAWPTREIKAHTTLKEMFNRLFCVFGVPEILYTDSSTNYKNKLFRECFEKLNITHIFGSPWHPQSQGLVERYNKTLKEATRTLINAKQTNWGEFIAPITFAMNASTVYSMGYSPYLLLFGRQAPIAPVTTKLTDKGNENLSVYDWFSKLMDTRCDYVTEAKSNLKSAQKKMVDRHNVNLRFAKFKVGDKVFLQNQFRLKKGTNLSLQDKYRGPYTIISLPSPYTAILKDEDGKTLSPSIHIKRLKKKPSVKKKRV